MKKKLISMGLCVMLLGTMCTSAFAGMDVAHNNADPVEESDESVITPRGLMCGECGGNMLNKRTYSDWVALKRTTCQHGYSFCTDEVRTRSVTDQWTCTRCGLSSLNTYYEEKQVCLGRL